MSGFDIIRKYGERGGQMIETDVLIVGAGPAGLAAAIALKRGAKKRGDGKSLRVLVLD